MASFGVLMLCIGHPLGWGRVLGLGSILGRSVPICMCGLFWLPNVVEWSSLWLGTSPGAWVNFKTQRSDLHMWLSNVLQRSYLWSGSGYGAWVNFGTQRSHLQYRSDAKYNENAFNTRLHAATNTFARGDEQVCTRRRTRLPRRHTSKQKYNESTKV